MSQRKILLVFVSLIALVLFSFFSFTIYTSYRSEKQIIYNLEFVVKPQLLSNLNSTKVFFRDDDVDKKSPQFQRLINIFLKKETPIALGVMPLYIDEENIDYLLQLKHDYPSLVEIDQHSYRHLEIGGTATGEFKGRRRLTDIEQEVQSGRSLMNQFFGEGNWSNIFTVPYSAYDNKLIEALASGGFSGISGHFPSNRISIGVIHHPDVYDYSTCLDIVDGWTNSNISFISKESFTKKYNQCKRTGKSVGIMLHHHTFTSEERFEYLEWIIDFVKNDTDVELIKMEDLYDDSSISIK